MKDRAISEGGGGGGRRYEIKPERSMIKFKNFLGYDVADIHRSMMTPLLTVLLIGC